MPNLGAPELIIIALVVLLLFGATRLPKLGKSMGQSISGFKKGLQEGDEELVEVVSVTEPSTDAAAANSPGR